MTTCTPILADTPAAPVACAPAFEVSREADIEEGLRNAVGFHLADLTALLGIEEFDDLVRETVDKLVRAFGLDGAAHLAGVEA